MKTSVITDRKIKLGLVGCGHIAQKHLAAIESLSDDLELVAACDKQVENIANLLKGKSVKTFSSYETLLEAKIVDVVILCTPSGLHAYQTTEAAFNKHHVICEKPMAVRWRDAVCMVEICKEADVQLFIVKQNRFNPTIQHLKQAIDKGRFGKIFHVNCNIYWTRPQSYYDQSPWRGTWAFDGGALMNQASHYVDLLRYLFGPVAKVQAFSGTLDRAMEAEDTIALNLQWRQGAIGSMNVTMLTYPKNFEGSITVIGEKGTVKLGGLAADKIQHWQFAEELPEDRDIVDLTAATNQSTGHTMLYQNIVNVFRGKESPLIDSYQGLQSLEIIIAAYRSARDGITVSLPLEL